MLQPFLSNHPNRLTLYDLNRLSVFVADRCQIGRGCRLQDVPVLFLVCCCFSYLSICLFDRRHSRRKLLNLFQPYKCLSRTRRQLFLSIKVNKHSHLSAHLYMTVTVSYGSSGKESVYFSVLTCYNLQVQQTGALANSIAGGTLVES